jgi:hypothetical protein
MTNSGPIGDFSLAIETSARRVNVSRPVETFGGRREV